MQLRQILATFLCFCTFSCFAQTVGQIKKVIGVVMVQRGDGAAPASIGMGINISDIIKTSADGAVGVAFVDNTILSLGPNSLFSVSSYAFNPTTHEGHMDGALQRGTLSMISGKLTKQSPESVKIKTPTAVLAVRGTQFLVEVKDGAR
jgi:hypothetical protein